ncbi:flagellar hook-basal body complex protein [Aminithiophilus ramosus]|uniref:Flagellar hook protein FlgE n=2 Tax=Synergistales TaxID=649776 RepID=A0A9Q7EY59_9BACT|nr:flagellar hook-basal body complex protein [Aminithiophilus ramosus]QTX31661.1 flagellar hook-basal body complex protein [Aminithiophilus ramosus]QVL35468.1 flagellar hook-basal body complex protein [Synergistota bacterium]
MLRSLMSGVTGVRSHQTYLDVVGNNVANVNTTGFKRSTVLFQDLLYQTSSGASAPTEDLGGINPTQVGLGVKVGAIQTIHSQGNLDYTGSRNDMAISGDGYFVLEGLGETVYSRAGAFTLDGEGKLAQSGTGYRLQGYQLTVDSSDPTKYVQTSTLADIEIPMGQKMEANATTTVGYRCNLDSRVDPYLPLGVPDGMEMNVTLLGEAYTASVSEGEEASNFLVLRLENQADGTVDEIELKLTGVTQATDGTYYPVLEPVDALGHYVNFNTETGMLNVDDAQIPLGAYMNYEPVTVTDANGDETTYLAEVTEEGNTAIVRLWGAAVDTSNATDPDTFDYFEWRVPRNDDGTFDTTAVLSVVTADDIEFPATHSVLLEVSDDGQALRFKANVNPTYAPSGRNSVVSKAGTTLASLSSVPTYTGVQDDFTLSGSLSASSVAEGDTVTLTLTTTYDDGTATTQSATVDLTCTGFDDATGFATFTVTPGTDTLYYYDGSAWQSAGLAATADATHYGIAYDTGTGQLTLTQPTGASEPAANPVSVAAFATAPTAYTSSSGNAVRYSFEEGATTDDFITLSLFDGGTPAETVSLQFKGVSADGEVILVPSTTTGTVDGTDVTYGYDPATSTFTVKNTDTGATLWSYSEFNFQTTEINGGQYLVDFGSSTAGGANYGDTITLWGPNAQGTMEPFTFGTGLTYSGGAYSGSAQVTGLTGGVTVTAIPNPSDSRKVLFSYESNAGGTQVASVTQNLASQHSSKVSTYDTLGNEHTLEVVWQKVGNNLWSWTAYLPDESTIPLQNNTGILRFTSDGKLEMGGTAEIGISYSAIGAEDATVTLDFSGESFDEEPIEGVTQFGSAFSTKAYTQDGYEMGVLEDYSVTSDGVILGVYSNDQSRALSRVALALFANPQGLNKEGDTVFTASANSGLPQIGSPTEGGAGSISGGNLEMSNVDLTEEFVRLILAQRGFQANARVITTSDDVLQELINLKR